MTIKVPIYYGGTKDNGFREKIYWARKQFGGDFVDAWELCDNSYWIMGNFRNEADVTLFKLKFGL